MATAGRMLATGMAPFILRFLITAYGWRNANRALGLFFAVVLFPLSMVIREPPKREMAPAGAGLTLETLLFFLYAAARENSPCKWPNT